MANEIKLTIRTKAGNEHEVICPDIRFRTAIIQSLLESEKKGQFVEINGEFLASKTSEMLYLNPTQIESYSVNRIISEQAGVQTNLTPKMSEQELRAKQLEKQPDMDKFANVAKAGLLP